MGKMSVSVYMKGDYGKISACRAEENKAKQSQFKAKFIRIDGFCADCRKDWCFC